MTTEQEFRAHSAALNIHWLAIRDGTGYDEKLANGFAVLHDEELYVRANGYGFDWCLCVDKANAPRICNACARQRYEDPEQ